MRNKTKEKIIIFGTTQHSHMLRRIIEVEDAAEIVAYTIDSKYLTKSGVEQGCKGLPLVPFETIEEFFSPNEYKILNTAGYSKMNTLRSQKSKQLANKGYELFTFISQKAIFLSEYPKGYGNVVMPGAYVGTNIDIGSNNVIYSGSNLTHDITVKDNTFIAAGSTVGGNVKIGSNCFLGLNSTIKNGITLADYTLIGASTYISHDSKKMGVYVPHRSIELNKTSIEIL